MASSYQALDEPAPRSDGLRVGVVYCEAHQTNENEFFSNGNAPLPPRGFVLRSFSLFCRLSFFLFFSLTRAHSLARTVETSPEFDQFLELLGEKIELLGWNGHNGGLDIQSTSTPRAQFLTRRARCCGPAACHC